MSRQFRNNNHRYKWMQINTGNNNAGAAFRTLLSVLAHRDCRCEW